MATVKEEQEMVDRWNATHLVGTPVLYWPLAREGDGVLSKTRSLAQMFGGHTAVVWVDGARGCIALDHVEAVA